MVVSIVCCRLRNPDAALGKPGDDVDQVAQRPASRSSSHTAGASPGRRRGVAGAELVKELLEGRAVGAGAAGSLSEHPVAAGALEGVDLEVWLLVGGGDARVAEQVTHADDGCRTSVTGLVVRR
jgi:hypothetical protein